jgi:hypothetical protein
MRISITIAGCITLAAAFAQPVYAEVDDSPYFNLWAEDPSAPPSNGSSGIEVKLCGALGCSGGDTAGTAFGIFRVATTDVIPAGSGYIDPFLRFQHNEGAFTGSNTFEAAFNTNSSPYIGTINNPDAGVAPANQNPEFGLPGSFDNMAKDVDAGKDFNHAIRLGDLAIDANGFFVFRLDINEPGGTKSTIRLDELQLFLSNDDKLTEYTMDKFGTGAGTLATGDLLGAKKVWDMDFNQSAGGKTKPDSPNQGDYYGGINLDSVLTQGPSNGSGDFDMDMLLSAKLFGYDQNKTTGEWEFKGIKDDNGVALTEDSFVYLYNFMGGVDKMDDPSQAGFEEWDVALAEALPTCEENCGGGGVPEPGTALLLMAGVAGMARVGRRRAETASGPC